MENSITVITSTIGRLSLLKLCKSLSNQNIKIIHLILWDKKRTDDGLVPNDMRFDMYINDNYNQYHYYIEHPFILEKDERIDNYLRSVGLSMTTTKYFTFIDDDCWLEDNWFNTAIEKMETNHLNYCFCRRNIWENETNKLGIDTYESIGKVNKFGYNLIDMNTLIYRSNIKILLLGLINRFNSYIIDRKISNYLLNKQTGECIDEGFINQICPSFLLDFHKENIA